MRSRRYGVSSKIYYYFFLKKREKISVCHVVSRMGFDLVPFAFEIVFIGTPEVQIHIRTERCDYTAIKNHFFVDFFKIKKYFSLTLR